MIYEKASLMPAYGADRLSDADLNDLVGYLTTLRKPRQCVRPVDDVNREESFMRGVLIAMLCSVTLAAQQPVRRR